MSKKCILSGAEAVGKTLVACGVTHFFYVMGGMTRMFPVLEKEGLNMILCRTEKGAATMADGYSRVTKKPSVCYGQHGAAAAIIASMLYEPMYCHSPVVALTGSVSTKEKDTWRYQECYEMSYFEPTCKFNVDVTDVSRLPWYIRTAIQIAVSGCPGPVHINMHLDMATAVAEMSEIYGDKKFWVIPPFRPMAEPERILEAAKMLASAERPVMLCGSGVHLSNAYAEVKELAELLVIPVVVNYRGKGCFPEEHPLYVGVSGSYGAEVANKFLREADVVFFVGTRAGSHETDDLTAPELGKSKIIHLDIDPIAIGRNYKTDIALVGDAKVTLRELINVVKKMLKQATQKTQRLQIVAAALKEYEQTVKPMMDSDSIPIKPQRIMKEVSKILKPRDIVVSDTGHMICWTTRFLKLKGTGLTYIPCGGTLGTSLGIAIGASFGAEEDQRVINLIGDGGMAYNLGELETARRYNDMHVPLVIVVNNNSSFAQGRPYFDDLSQIETPWINCCDLGELNFAKIAESFGCYGVRIERPGEIGDAIKNAFESNRIGVIDIVSDKREYPPLGWLREKIRKESAPKIPLY